jgi:hypothetical protein
VRVTVPALRPALLPAAWSTTPRVPLLPQVGASLQARDCATASGKHQHVLCAAVRMHAMQHSGSTLWQHALAARSGSTLWQHALAARSGITGSRAQSMPSTHRARHGCRGNTSRGSTGPCAAAQRHVWGTVQHQEVCSTKGGCSTKKCAAPRCAQHQGGCSMAVPQEQGGAAHRPQTA